jgi:nucleoside-diphosphate-sugar epimerase/SAM-dependent methyltransferase/dTDP-4-dehydrorhamnose 3,5-epimerase-like enzyme
MSKIVITGGLGYIGTQLSKLYIEENLEHDVHIVDRKFLPERVKELKSWGFKYHQSDLLDKKFFEELLKEADVVYHLGGITDVAYVKSKSNDEQDKHIREVGVTGTRNIIDSVGENTKVIFPSTHVVYEGFEETEFDLTENVETCPVLTYSKGKVQSEEDLENSSINYIVLRLGSVYGYGGDSMRINIMPNLFSKMSAIGNPIKLFGGGVQWKSLVSLFDVASCMKFMAERDDIQRQVFHLRNENMTVKDVAEICKEFVPALDLTETDDEIPNQGYTLSNQKLLDTGFEFRNNIRDDIKGMIDAWSDSSLRRDVLEYKFDGGKEFVDERGRITNYELPEPINWIGWIESKKGTVRANHWHPIQQQKCILISGRYISVFKDLKTPNAPMTTQLMEPGDVVVTEPQVAHTMVFLEDSLFLNLVNGEREHENFGKHTIPYELVDERMRVELLENYKSECRSCGNSRLECVVSLGNSPLANNLLDDENQEDELYPLQMNYCPDCHNCQLSHSVPREKMFNEYLYVSSTTETFRKHFSDAADSLTEEFELREGSFVVDIGSNDGVFLKPLQEKGVSVCGVEPAKNLSYLAEQNGIPTINGYFEDDSTIIQIKQEADLVTAFNVFAHSDNLEQITRNAFQIMKSDGCFIVEVQYLYDTLKEVTFDNIYHEHYNYWSVISLKNFFEKLGLQVVNVQHVDTHGGSIRVYVGANTHSANPSVSEFIQKEKEFGLDKLETYKEFTRKVEKCKEESVSRIKILKEEGKSIVGYGSPAKATTVLNYFGIDGESIDYIIEDNELKHGKLLPGVRIPIKGKNGSLDENPPDNILVLAWNFFDYIKSNNEELVNKGCEFITLKD